MSVFKESSRTHLDVRTPIKIGMILVLVIILSALFYYALGRAATVPPGLNFGGLDPQHRQEPHSRAPELARGLHA